MIYFLPLLIIFLGGLVLWFCLYLGIVCQAGHELTIHVSTSKVLKLWLYTTIHRPLSFIFFLQCLFNFSVFLETTLSLYPSCICCLSVCLFSMINLSLIIYDRSISIFLSSYPTSIWISTISIIYPSIYLIMSVIYLSIYVCIIHFLQFWFFSSITNQNYSLIPL